MFIVTVMSSKDYILFEVKPRNGEFGPGLMTKLRTNILRCVKTVLSSRVWSHNRKYLEDPTLTVRLTYLGPVFRVCSCY